MMFVVFLLVLPTVCSVAAGDSSYDYSATIECIPEPLGPQYNGGLVKNPSFDLGSNDWNVFGNAKIAIRKSQSSGNSFLVAYNRTKTYDSFSQTFDLQKDILYTFSAWMQLGSGEEIITAYVVTPKSEYLNIGSVIAKSGCWSMLKGGFTADYDMKAPLYFVSNSTGEVWLDNVSLKPFTRKEWQDQQNRSIHKLRKRQLKIHVTTKDGVKLEGAKIALNQIRPHFMLGCSSTEMIRNTTPYQNWFLQRFPATSFNNEMKWYYTQGSSLEENYSIPDGMVDFFKKNRVSIRGHTILWDDPRFIQNWVKGLPPKEILSNAIRHTGSVVSRYLGDVIGWDVMNENMHNRYFEDMFGANSSAMFFQIAHAISPQTPLFLNEYNTLETPVDMVSIPWKYIEKIQETKAFPGNEEITLKIGLQGHFFVRPNVSYVRSCLDLLGATKLPIWMTEMDIRRGPTQAAELEDVLREVYSHPSVEGIILWGGWKPTICNDTCVFLQEKYEFWNVSCSKMCLTDNNFKNTKAGDVVDKYIREWRTTNVTGNTKKDGVYTINAFHGEYSLSYSHPSIRNVGQTTFNVTNDGSGPSEIFVIL